MPQKRPLRVLYTVNGSSQYILSRSSQPEDVSIVESAHQYGMVNIRMCLETICRSSPELLQDKAIDYSVYVLDPLESGYMPSGSSTPNTPGVAVALGPMSCALRTSPGDSSLVNGTFVKMSNGQEALEVVLSLRETARNCDSQDEPDAKRRTKDKQKEKRPSTNGPECKPTPHIHTGLSVSRQATEKDALASPASPKPLTLPDVLALLSMTAGNEAARNAAILAALNTIDGSSSRPSDPSTKGQSALVAALREMLPSSSQTPVPSTKSHLEKDHDDEIVVLDKENVNPKAFRRRAERDKEQPRPLASASLKHLSSTTTTTTSVTTTTRSVGTNSTTCSTNNEALSRLLKKRTLSQFLDEAYPPKEDGPFSTIHSMRRTVSERVVPSSENRSFLDRSLTNLHTSSHSRNPDRGVASSPPRRKPFVIPQWAKTETATTPRLSAERQAQLDAEREEQEEQRKEKERMKRAKRKDRALVQPRARPPTRVASAPPPPRPSTPTSTTLPVFASSDIIFGAGPSSPPRTPPRRKDPENVAPTSPIALFTPSPRRGGASPLFSPAARGTPFANRHSILTDDGDTEDLDEEALTLDLERAMEELNDSEPCDLGDSESNWRPPPPSSPLPPSSPPPMSQDTVDDDEDMLLVVRTEVPPSTDTEGDTDQTCSTYFTDSFGLLPEIGSDSIPAVSDDEVFEFLNFDAHESDDLLVAKEGLGDMDFAQLWESMKPLLEPDLGNSQEKVSEQIRDLFSGCLL